MSFFDAKWDTLFVSVFPPKLSSMESRQAFLSFKYHNASKLELVPSFQLFQPL